ncbi:DUF1127 domain-containing protein [Bradyrhizobium sp.]|uniref:DUF1127 domain-containing protein n=1 Tax=Bradyrhizobium sp. TaxID=376 RepID=UPI0032C23009
MGGILEWRKFEKLRTGLNDLTDRELMDIGISRGEIDYEPRDRSARRPFIMVGQRKRRPRPDAS